MESFENIFDYITAEENRYLTMPTEVTTNWQWLMPQHINRSVLYKNSQYETGKTDEKPFRNIIIPLLRLQYRTEGFDLKDIIVFINNSKKYFKSLIIRKFHTEWGLKNKIDTFIDNMVESYVDFGLVIVERTEKAVPKVVPLQSIAFCDTTNILGGPIGFKLFMSPSELKEQKNWGNPEFGADATIEEAIMLSSKAKTTPDFGKRSNPTSGKYLEIYKVDGMLPERFLGKKGDKYVQQRHIVAFVPIEDKKEKMGITLFRARQADMPYKALEREAIFGRAAGLGGVEELFDAQIWTNYDQIRLKEMLDEAAKIIYHTTDPSIAARQNTRDMETGEILTRKADTEFGQVDNFPRNAALFDKAIQDWSQHAQTLADAPDALLGKEPSSGTPFKLQDLVVDTGLGQHDYRQGKISTFMDEIYRDWILPKFAREVVKDQEFLAELDLEDMQFIAEGLANTHINKKVKEAIQEGIIPNKEELEALRVSIREEFMEGGNKRFMQLLEGEFKDAPLGVKTNIAGKQFALNQRVDKLVNVIRQVIASPQILENKGMANIFNQIVEGSGLNPVDFSGIGAITPQKQEIVPQREEAVV